MIESLLSDTFQAIGNNDKGLVSQETSPLLFMGANGSLLFVCYVDV